jgi:oligopeptidase B
MKARKGLGRLRRKPPEPYRENGGQSIHGEWLADPYGWMRAENWRETLGDARRLPGPIMAHLRDENDYAARILRPLSALRSTIRAEMRGRIREDESWPPEKDGPFAYQSRYRLGGEHPLILRTPREGGAETTLFDGDALAKGKTNFAFGEFSRSPDHSLIAWSHDPDGSERHVIAVRDAASGKDSDYLTDAAPDIVWMADGTGFLYLGLDRNQRASRLFHHRLGEPQKADRLVLEEEDPAFSIDLGESLDGLYAIISSADLVSTEIRLLPLAGAGPAPPLLVRPREGEIRYDIEHWQGTFFLLINSVGAKDFKLLQGRLGDGDPADWAEIVPHRPGVLIEEFAVTARHLIRIEVENALPRIVIREIRSGEEHAVDMADAAYSIGFDEGAEFETERIRIAHESPARPQEIHEYDLSRRSFTLLKRQEIPSGHQPEAYRVERLFARAEDGETIPITLLRRRDKQGPSPLLLYGYGSYGYSLPAAFSTGILSLVDRGMPYAVAHVRGGMEKGHAWHEQGRLEAKENTFSDFLAVARHLVETGVTEEGCIVAEGRSAGGLLMGVIANRAPHLFAGIVAAVPFVDVMNTMLDADLPLTPGEWKEWGNPIADEAAFHRMRAWSPYDAITAQAYPPILALGSTGDPRVTYWEPAKWIARLRAEGQGGPFLLKTNMKAGHFGASGRLESLEEAALIAAFALRVTGLG